MTNKKSTKRALLMSALSLFLCIAMLAGTTFAWFTDSVSSKNNIITAGNLDIELEYKNVKGGELAKEWMTVKDASDVFDPKALWEPGRVEVVYLKVSNLGTLDLKYQLSVNVYDEVVGKTEDGEDVRLSDHLVFKVVEMPDALATYTDREAVEVAAGTEKGLKDYNGKTTPLSAKSEDPAVNDEDYVALIVYMPENVGNEANYRGDVIPKIELGINLFATQLASEEDSFGSDYDEDAWNDSMTVYNAADLYSAMTVGGKVNVVADIALSEPLMAANDTVINLNGKKLTANGEALNITDGAKVEIVNGAIEVAAEAANAIAVTNNKAGTTSTLDLNNVEINFADVADPDYNAIVVEAEAGKAVLNVNDGTELNVVADWATPIFAGKNSEVNVNGGVINVENTLTNAYCTWGIYVTDSSAVINITDGVFNVTGVHSASGIYAYDNNITPTVNISGGTFNVETSGGYGIAVEVYRGTVNATGGIFNIRATGGTAYAFEENSNPGVLDLNVGSGVTINVWERNGNKAYESGNANPNADCSAVINEMTVAGDGLSQNGNTYYIESANGLSYFSEKALTKNDTTAETVIIELMTDIDMNGANFSAVIAQRGDALIFNGNGHTISNVNVVSGANDNTTGSAGMFYCYPNSTLTVSDLTLKDVVVTSEKNGTGYASAVIGYCEGAATLNNVDVVDATIVGVKSSGILAGHVSGSLTATNCDVSGTVTLDLYDGEPNGHYAGELIGTVAGPVVLNDCTLDVTVAGNLNAANIGIIFGRKTAAGSVIIGGAKVVATADQLQAALDNAADGDVIKFIADIEGDVTVAQKEGVNIVIDGANYKYDGTIYIDGKARYTGTDTLYIKNINFATAKDGVDFISSNIAKQYAHNVTIEGCTFTNNGTGTVVPARFRQAYNITMKNCTVEGTFSPLWTTGVQGLTIQNVTANCANEGMTIGASNNVLIEDCTITVPGDDSFGIRTDATDGYKLTVNNCTLNVATPIVIRGSSDTYTVIVDGAVQKAAASQSELESAVASGNVDVTLADGNYSFPGTNGDVTISGTTDTVITVSGTPTGSDVTFNGVTIKGSGYSTGVNANTVTYNKCTIIGEMCLYNQKVVFNKCIFELNGQYIWTYGAAEVEFINCTFNTTGKAILIYNEGDGASKVTVKDCIFNASAGATASAISNQNCAAIEIDNFQNNGMPGTGHVLTTEGNTINGDFSGEWRIKNYQDGDAVTVNGVTYTQTALDGTLLTVVNKEVQ